MQAAIRYNGRSGLTTGPAISRKGKAMTDIDKQPESTEVPDASATEVAATEPVEVASEAATAEAPYAQQTYAEPQQTYAEPQQPYTQQVYTDPAAQQAYAQPAYGQPGYAPMHSAPVPPKKKNGFALNIVGLVLSILGLCIPGLICNIVGFSKANKIRKYEPIETPGDNTRASWIIGLIGIIAGAIFLVMQVIVSFVLGAAIIAGMQAYDNGDLDLSEFEATAQVHEGPGGSVDVNVGPSGNGPADEYGYDDYGPDGQGYDLDGGTTGGHAGN